MCRLLFGLFTEEAPAIQENARQMPFCALQLCLSVAALPAVAVTVSLLSHGGKIETYMYFQILFIPASLIITVLFTKHLPTLLVELAGVS